MSIMDAFRTALGVPQQAVNPANLPQPGNLPVQQPTMLQGTDPQIPNTLTAPAPATPIEPPKSPLDEFNKLWEPIKTPDGSGNVTFNIDPTKVNAAASGIDFMKSLDPTLVAKINAGGPEATVAMMQAINQVGQQAFAQATMSNAKIMETALGKARENMLPEVKTMVRNEQISSTLRTDNPLYTNPSIAPVLSLLETQFAATFPTATPAEIKQKAQTYLTGMAAEINKTYVPQAQVANSGGTMEVDWSKF